MGWAVWGSGGVAAGFAAVGRSSGGAMGGQKRETSNRERLYSHKINPISLPVSFHVAQFGHPMGTDPNRFHLIVPHQPDPRLWLKMAWFDQYSGNAPASPRAAGMAAATWRASRLTATCLMNNGIIRDRNSPTPAEHHAADRQLDCSSVDTFKSMGSGT